MVHRQDLDNTSAYLSVTIPREQIQSKLDAELKRFRQRAAIKGFRQGQAPMDYVRRMYGQALFTDQLNDMISKELVDYLRESRLDVLGQPLPTEEQQKFSFNINQLDPEYIVRYEVGFVAPFDVQGLGPDQQFERITVADLDELAEADLESTRRRGGKRTNPEDDIQDNDIVRLAARELEGDAVKEDGWQPSISALRRSA